MQSPTPESLRESLRSLRDPATGRDLVEAGLIDSLEVPTKPIPGVPDLMHHKFAVRDGQTVTVTALDGFAPVKRRTMPRCSSTSPSGPGRWASPLLR